jgi:protein TonB
MSSPIKIFGLNLLAFTIPASLLTHVVVGFGIVFSPPEPPAPTKGATFDVTIVSPSNAKAPKKADFIANSNQEGSGSKDEKSTLKSKFAAKEENLANGDELLTSEKTVKAVTKKLEPELLTTKGKTNKLINKLPEEEEQLEPKTTIVDNSDQTEEIAKLMAEMSQDEERFARRPRIRFIDSLSAKGAVEAEYIMNWSKKMERIGNINFPKKALDLNLSGTLILNVTLDRAGRAVSIDISTGSGSKILDNAAIRIVKLASPYEPLPKEVRAKFDRLNITRTIVFHKGEGEEAKFYSK